MLTRSQKAVIVMMKDNDDDDEKKLYSYTDFEAVCNRLKLCYLSPVKWLELRPTYKWSNKMKDVKLQEEWDQLVQPLTSVEKTLQAMSSKTIETWFQTMDYVFDKWKFTESRILQEAEKIYEQRLNGTYEKDQELKENVEDVSNSFQSTINKLIDRCRKSISQIQEQAKSKYKYTNKIRSNLAQISGLIDELESLKQKQMKSIQWSAVLKVIQTEQTDITSESLNRIADSYDRIDAVWNGAWSVSKDYKFSLQDYYGFTGSTQNDILDSWSTVTDKIESLTAQSQQQGTFTSQLEYILAEMDELLKPGYQFCQQKHTVYGWGSFNMNIELENKLKELTRQAQMLADEGLQMDISGKLKKSYDHHDDDGSLSWFINHKNKKQQGLISAKGGPKRIILDEEEDEKQMNNHYDQEEEDDDDDDDELSETEDEDDLMSGASKSPVQVQEQQQQQQQQQKMKRDENSLFTTFRNEGAIQGSVQLPTMFQTDPELLQREYYYSDDESYTVPQQKENKPFEQLKQTINSLEFQSNLILTENITISNTKQVATINRIKQLFQEAKFSDYAKKEILTAKVCKILIFLVRVTPKLAQMSEEVTIQYPGLIARLNNYLQWSYEVMVNMDSVLDKVAVELPFPTGEEEKNKNPTVEETRDRFLQEGILEAFKAQKVMRSWLEEIPKLYRFSMEQIEYFVKEIQANNNKLKLTKALQIRAQYRELRLYEADTIALTGDDFEEAENVEKHRAEINAFSIEGQLPEVVVEDYKETLGNEDKWSEDVSIVEYDYPTDGLGVYEFRRFWTPYPEALLFNGLLSFLQNLWDIQQRIGPLSSTTTTSSQIFQFVALTAAEDFRYTYDKFLLAEDVYNQVKKDVKNPSLKRLTLALDSLLKRVHEEGNTDDKRIIPLDWLRPIVQVYRTRFEDRLFLESGKATGKAISDAEGFQMLEELFHVNAYLNTIYRRFALVLLPRLLREIELDDRTAKKEAAKDKARLARNLGFQEQVNRELVHALAQTDDDSFQSELDIQEKIFIRNLQIYTQEDVDDNMMEEEKTAAKKNLKPGEMYRKHALQVIRELYEVASAELIYLIADQKNLVEDVPPRYEYWFKQARAKKEDQKLVEALNEDRKQLQVVSAGWQERVGKLNERLLGFLLHTFELSEGSNTLRRETMEDIIHMFFELYRNVKQFEEGFQEAMSPILKCKDMTDLKKMMKRRSFVDNRDSKLFKAYKNKEKMQSLVKTEPGLRAAAADDSDKEEKLIEVSTVASSSVRIDELQSRIASAASTWAQRLDDQIDEVLEGYQAKTGLQQIIANFRNWKKTTKQPEQEIVTSFRDYIEEFKLAIEQKKKQFHDPESLMKLQSRQIELEATVKEMTESKTETKKKLSEMKGQLNRINQEIQSLDPKEKPKVEERLLKIETLVQRIWRNFDAAVAYLTLHPYELSWATVYASLGLVGVVEEEQESESTQAQQQSQSSNRPKRQISNKIEKAEIKIRDDEPMADMDDDDEELEIEYVKYGIRINELIPQAVKAEPNFHALDEVKTDDLEIMSSTIRAPPITLEGKKAKIMITALRVAQERYDHLNEPKPDLNDYRANELESALTVWMMGEEDNLSYEDAKLKAKQDVIQYMQSNNNNNNSTNPVIENTPIVKQEIENRKRPADDIVYNNNNNNNTNNNNMNIDDLMPLPTRVETKVDNNNQGPLMSSNNNKRQRIPKKTIDSSNNSNISIVRKTNIPILPFIRPAPLEKPKPQTNHAQQQQQQQQMDTSGFFDHHYNPRKDKDENEVYSLVNASMVLLRRTPLGISMLEDVFGGQENMPPQFDVVVGQEYKPGIAEECKFITSTLITSKVCVDHDLWQALVSNRTQIELMFDLIITESYNRNNEAEFDTAYVFWSKRHASRNFGHLTALEREIRQLYAGYYIIFAFTDFEAEKLSGMKSGEYTQYKTTVFDEINELEDKLNQEGAATGLQKLEECHYIPKADETLKQFIQNNNQDKK